MDPNSLKVAELRNELSARGLSTKGVKKELVARLEEALANDASHQDATSVDNKNDSPMEQEPPSHKKSTEEEERDKETREDIAQVAQPIQEDKNAPAEESIVSAPAPIPAPTTSISALEPVVGTPSLPQEGFIDTTSTSASVMTEKPSASAPMEQVEAAPVSSGQKRSKSGADEFDQEHSHQGEGKGRAADDGENVDDTRSAKKARHDHSTSESSMQSPTVAAGTPMVEGERRSDAPSPSSSQTTARTSSSPTQQQEQQSTVNASTSPDSDRRGSRRMDARSLMERQVREAAKDRTPDLSKDTSTDAPDALTSERNDKEAPSRPAGTDRALAIVNFVRPLTLPQVKRMLSEFGEIEQFWMDNIKTHCYVIYTTPEMAQKAYNGVKGVVFPKETGKALEPHFISAEDALRSMEEADKAQNNKQRPTIFLGDHASMDTKKAEAVTVPATSNQKAKPDITAAAAAVAVAAAAATAAKEDALAAQKRKEEKKARQPQPQIVQPNELFQRTTTLPVLYFKALVDPSAKSAPAMSE